MKFSLDRSIAFYIVLLAEWMKYCLLIANHSFEQLKHSLICKNVARGPCYCEGECDLSNVLSVFFGMVIQCCTLRQEACLKFRRVLFSLESSPSLRRETLVNSNRSHSKTVLILIFFMIFKVIVSAYPYGQPQAVVERLN